MTHSPGGQESELSTLLSDEFRSIGLRPRTDAMGNVLVSFEGVEDSTILISAHLDEVSMIVKRVESNGYLRVAAAGGAYPYKYGEGPVEILGDGATIPGILSIGGVHITRDSTPQYEIREGNTGSRWSDWWIDTKLPVNELAEVGVHPGTRVVVAKSRKNPLWIGDYVSGYGLDDKGAIPILLGLAESFSATPPGCNVVLAASVGEELGGAGFAFLAHRESPDLVIGLEIAPAVAEYGIQCNSSPALWWMDKNGYYDVGVLRSLTLVASDLHIDIQHLVLEAGASEVGVGLQDGLFPRGVVVGFPAENSHGWEIVHCGALENILDILIEFIRRQGVK